MSSRLTLVEVRAMKWATFCREVGLDPDKTGVIDLKKQMKKLTEQNDEQRREKSRAYSAKYKAKKRAEKAEARV